VSAQGKESGGKKEEERSWRGDKRRCREGKERKGKEREGV